MLANGRWDLIWRRPTQLCILCAERYVNCGLVFRSCHSILWHPWICLEELRKRWNTSIKAATAIVKKPTITETIRLNRLRCFGHVQRMEENRIPKRVLYMNFGSTRLRGKPRNRWQDEVREDGRIVGGEGWQEKVHNREEWKKLLRKARNRHILHVPMEWMKWGPPHTMPRTEPSISWIWRTNAYH